MAAATEESYKRLADIKSLELRLAEEKKVRAGLRILAAFMEPSASPAPTMVCTSSITRMMLLLNQLFGGGSSSTPAPSSGEGSAAQPRGEKNGAAKPAKRKFLDNYCISLTQRAQEGRLDKLIGRGRGHHPLNALSAAKGGHHLRGEVVQILIADAHLFHHIIDGLDAQLPGAFETQSLVFGGTAL